MDKIYILELREQVLSAIFSQHLPVVSFASNGKQLKTFTFPLTENFKFSPGIKIQLCHKGLLIIFTGKHLLSLFTKF